MANGAGGCVRGLDPQQPWSDGTRGQYPGPRDTCPQSIVRVTLSWVGPPADVSAELTGPPTPTTSLKTTSSAGPLRVGPWVLQRLRAPGRSRGEAHSHPASVSLSPQRQTAACGRALGCCRLNHRSVNVSVTFKTDFLGLQAADIDTPGELGSERSNGSVCRLMDKSNDLTRMQGGEVCRKNRTNPA